MDEQAFDAQAFVAQSSHPEIALNRTASLDLTQARASVYYFNKDNTLEYTKNWFNYSLFQDVHPNMVISELVQFAYPEMAAAALDTSKTYALPSTTMTPAWAARMENRELRVDFSAIAGRDQLGNLYVVDNYVSNGAVTPTTQVYVYNEDGSLFGTKLPNGTLSSCVALTKYNASGVAQWTTRIRSLAASQTVYASSCVTDQQGNTYVLVSGTNNTSGVACENPFGVAILSASASQKTYLIAYNPNGNPLWMNYCSGEHTGTVTVDNQPIGHVFVMLENLSSANVDFYDNVPSSPSVSLTVPAVSKLVLARYSTSGLFQWATYISGYRVGCTQTPAIPLVAPSFSTQTLACDAAGNVVVTGYFNQVDPFVDAATAIQPVFRTAASSTELPYTSQVVWIPRDSNRQWSAVDVESTGRYMLAVVRDGFVYLSTNYGMTWGRRATRQNWSSVFCGLDGGVMLASVYLSSIYRSVDGGDVWLPTGLEGNTARKWVALAGNTAGSQFVAAATNDRLYYSTDYGALWYVSESVVPTGALTLNAGENGLVTAVLSINQQYTYFSTDTSPSQIVKVDVTTFPNPTRVGALVLNSGENQCRAVTRYVSGTTQQAFYATLTAPSRVVQVDLAPALPTHLSATSLVSFFTITNYYSAASPVGVITSNGLYAYYATDSVVISGTGQTVLYRLDLSNPSGPVMDRTLNVGNATANPRTLLINAANTYLYGTSGTFLYRVDLSTFTAETNFTALQVDAAGPFYTCVLDSAGTYGYYGGSTSPAKIVRVNLTTSPSPTRIGAVTLNAGEDDLRSSVIDPLGQYAYFGTNTSPGKIVKIDLSTFPNPTRVGALTLATGQNVLSCAVIDPLGQFAYFGTNTNPGQIIKVNLSTFTVAGTLVTSGVGQSVLSRAVVDSLGQYAYFLARDTVLKIDLATFTIANVFNGGGGIGLNTNSQSLLLNGVTNKYYRNNGITGTGGYTELYQQDVFTGANEYYTFLDNYFECLVQCIAQTPSGMAFLGANTSEGSSNVIASRRGSRIIKYDLVNNRYLGSFNLPSGEINLISAVADPAGQYAYFGTNTSPGKIVKINVNAMINNPNSAVTPRVASLTLNSLENGVSCAVVDPAGQYGYFGTNTSPGVIVKVDLTTFTRVASIGLIPGEDYLVSAWMDPIGKYAYFGTNTSPGKVIAIQLASFTRPYARTLAAGQNLLTCGVCTPSNQLILGTNTSPGIVVRTEVQYSAPVADWADVAYDATSDSYIAVIRGGQAYRSADGGVSWTLLSACPVAQWSSIGSARIAAPTALYTYYAVVDGGAIYGVNSSGTVWAVLDSPARAYSAVATSGGDKPMTFASVYDGPIEQSIVPRVRDWFPTTIPRNWNAVAVTSTNGTLYAVAAVEGGQLYVTTDPYPRLHTVLVKYDSFGRVLWTNYVNCPTGNEGDNTGTAVTTTPAGEILLAGTYTSTLEFFSAGQLTNVIKTLSIREPTLLNQINGINYIDGYMVKYSSDGIPLWTNSMICTPLTSGAFPIPVTALQTDQYGNVYAIGTSNGVSLYNPDGYLCYVNTGRSNILVKYTPDGYTSSYTALNDTNGVLRSGSILIHPQGTEYTLSSLVSSVSSSTPQISCYTSLGTTVGLTESFAYAASSGVILVKYALSSSAAGSFLTHTYNNPLQPRFAIGGGNRYLSDDGRYVIDQTPELWGGQPGLAPSEIGIADVNIGSISYLGHQPGYTIPTFEGLLETSKFNFTHLAVRVTEPSFPANDANSTGPGTVPYGFLPIYVQFPAYATGAQFNSTVLTKTYTPLRLSATGPISASGLLVTGLQPGDTVRIAVTNASTTRYITLQVNALIPSDTVTQTQTAIEFVEPTRWLINTLGAVGASAPMWIPQSTAGANTVPMWVQPILITEGQLNVILQLYPVNHP